MDETQTNSQTPPVDPATVGETTPEVVEPEVIEPDTI